MPIIATIPTAAINDAFKLRPIFEARERLNRRVNQQFSSKTNSDTTLFEQRYRVGFSYQDNQTVRGQFIYQYSNDVAWTAKKNYSYQASDLYVGDADFKTNGDGDLIIGRQILKKGGERLFQESSFNQRSKSFDMVRYRNANWDFFSGRPGLTTNPADKAIVTGGSYDSKFGETMIVDKHDQWVSHEDFFTGDQRYVTAVGRGRGKLEMEFEGAGQKGRYNGLYLSSWFVHGRVGHGMGKEWGTYIEADAFSGGKNSREMHGFDNLYGESHAFMGRMDVVGPRNLNEIEAAAAWKPSADKSFAVTFDRFWLRDPRDGFYSTSLTLNPYPGGTFIDPTGQRGTDLGQEADILGRWDLNRNVYLSFESGLFQPGKYIRSFTGNFSKSQLWGIIYVNYKY
jgi:hypothetical protein